MDGLRVPLKKIQERIGHALTGRFTLDGHGHTLDWTANEHAAKRLGEEIAKAVASRASATTIATGEADDPVGLLERAPRTMELQSSWVAEFGAGGEHGFAVPANA
jgi:hypothetical protein